MAKKTSRTHDSAGDAEMKSERKRATAEHENQSGAALGKPEGKKAGPETERAARGATSPAVKSGSVAQTASEKTQPPAAAQGPSAGELRQDAPLHKSMAADKPAALAPEPRESSSGMNASSLGSSKVDEEPGQAAGAPAEAVATQDRVSPPAARASSEADDRVESLERRGLAPTEPASEPNALQPAAAPPADERGGADGAALEAQAVPMEAPPISEPTVTEDLSMAHQLPSLFIVHITPEMAPIAKVGGLADVVFGLTRELTIRGNHVEILLPKYDNMRYDHIWGLTPTYNDLWVPWYEGAIHCTVYFGFVQERKCFFIEPHSHDNFFNRGSIYGFRDDILRYAFFSRAAMEFLWKSGKNPDVIHCHDWQTALVPIYLYEIYQHLGMHHPRVCLTIHNFKHQGVTGSELLRATGLHHPERFLDYRQMRDNHNPHALNILKAGIVYSNFIATVSPRYAFETKDQGHGFGLEPTLHTHHMKYGGVVNGVDYDVWNPEVDSHIPVDFSIDSIDDKYDNKRALRHRLMLADNEKPIVAFIGRLDPQKGLELVRHAIFFSLERGAQFVLLGSSPDQGINADFWGLKRMLNDSPDCHLEIGFDEDLAHLIYAGADMMLVPSRFEPCGLTQLIAMRYGTIPIVRAIGGLADTVFDKDHSHRPLHERNGYLFENYDQAGLESALGRAIACYFNHPEHFRELMKNAMRYDYSWNIPGQDYLNIYHYIRSK
jgi:starch synthase